VARLIVIAVPDGLQTRRILEIARSANSRIHAIARTHSAAELKQLEQLGADRVVMGERELALGMLGHTLDCFGLDESRVRSTVEETRKAGT
jgi:CPA2 family monovalent cation:H+ antiporter-2